MSKDAPKALPILPAKDGRETPLFAVVMILCFCACLAGLAALAAGRAASLWTAGLSTGVTVRVIEPRDPAKIADLAAAFGALPGVTEARVISEAELSELLEPWLGAGGLPQDAPIPSLIALEVDPSASPSSAQLIEIMRARDVRGEVDGHDRWAQEVLTAAGQVRGVAFGALGVLAFAAASVVAFAARAGLAIRRDVVETLHLIGARDGFIAGLFQWRYLRLGLSAGAFGAVLALASVFLIAATRPSAADRDWLLPSFSPDLLDIAAIACAPLLAGAIAMLTARVTVLQQLRRKL
ncbi:MAG TPA: cell division protein FtsX [Hyphomonadaceae bacterium]|nr:cell division protein FtsX [Hyphomonadaceae bacterium]